MEVRAPATTANLGPGYDCLGMALDLWNTLTVEVLPAGSEPAVVVSGEGAGELDVDTQNLTYRAMEFLFNEADVPIPPLSLRCENTIPLSRGMGSSAAAISGGLVAANRLLDDAFGHDDLLEMAATIEGHPDNVAAAIHGGMRLVVLEDNRLYTAPIRVPEDMQAVLFIPDRRIATADARRVLPGQISVADAVYNMSRTALLVASMESEHPEYLNIATQDRLHQPYRQTIFPQMKVIFAAAQAAGAFGVFLSGSGSTILAFARDRAMTVAYEMFDAARLAGVEGRVEVTQPTTLGAHVATPVQDD
ncbi:MAG: homoserine kinase [Chloroflexi bacterium]|nr:homoserine kinase [Chloroflexota bacterium]